MRAMILNGVMYEITKSWIMVHVMWIHHKSMVHSQVKDGGDGLQIWRVAANTLNKQSQTIDKGWFYSWRGLGEGLTTLHHKKECYKMLQVRTGASGGLL
jgi:hypothetical protein